MVPLHIDVLDPERSESSRFEFPRRVQEVDILCGEKNLLAG